MSEFLVAWRSDLRVLIGHEVSIESAYMISTDPRSLYEFAVMGAQQVDRLHRDSVNVCPRMKHEAEARVCQ